MARTLGTLLQALQAGQPAESRQESDDRLSEEGAGPLDGWLAEHSLGTVLAKPASLRSVPSRPLAEPRAQERGPEGVVLH